MNETMQKLEAFGAKHKGALALSALAVGGIAVVMATKGGSSGPTQITLPPQHDAGPSPTPTMAPAAMPDFTGALDKLSTKLQTQSDAQAAQTQALADRFDATQQAAIATYQQELQASQTQAQHDYQSSVDQFQALRAADRMANDSYTQSAIAIALEKQAMSMRPQSVVPPTGSSPSPAIETARVVAPATQVADPTIARDGQSLASQAANIQRDFYATWGAAAPLRWVYEHNKAIG